jgi:hypothetical protein
VSWKYFGYTDGVCGCYTARVDAREPTAVKSRRVAGFPHSQATATISACRKTSPRSNGVKQQCFEELFRRGVKVSDDDQKPDLSAFNPSTRIGNVDFREDDDVETFLAVRGKLYPLHSSSLYSRKLS